MEEQKSVKWMKRFTIYMVCLFSSTLLMAQSAKISGVVLDETSTAVIGGSVTIKGTTIGTLTDLDGRFTLDAPNESSVLVVSFVGYTTQEIKIGTKRTFNIVLKEDQQLLDEVVVVGYGVQKKVNLTGAVGAVNSSELNSRIAPSTSSLLQGKMPGLQVTQNSAMPGSEGVEMRIRGMGTFSSAGNNPLVLIDGVEGDMNKLNPNIIESISVLKDASSAAIYGSRAANGVVLVTTKAGHEGRLNVEYSFNYSVQKPTKPMDRITNSVEYMETINKAIEFSNNLNETWKYTDEQIERYRRGQDPNDPTYNPAQYPNTDWMDYLIRTAPIRQHFLSVNGGRGGTTFNVGLGYLDQTGLLLGTDYKRYDVQVNFKSSLTKRVTFGTNITMNYGVRHDTSFSDKTSDMGNMNASRDQMRCAYAGSPLMTPQLPDGSGRWSAYAYEAKGGNKNPIASAMSDGGQLEDKNYLLASGFMNVNIIKGLNAEVKGAVKFVENQNKMMNATWNSAVFLPDADGVYEDRPSSSKQSFLQSNNRAKQYTLFGTLNYTTTLKEVHNISAMAGYSQENYIYEQIDGYRVGYTNADMWYLKSGPTPSQTNGSEVNEWALMSYFGRINYDYMNKYLFEANVRYDGTSRLPKDGRWGTFPSASVGWRISEEAFMKPITFLDNLKVRASWGQLGNQNIGNYPYQAMLSDAGYNFGGTMTSGFYNAKMVNTKIKWETTTSTNIGLDFGFFGNKLYGSIDWYRKYTTDILRSLQVPSFVGVSGPTVNMGEMKNIGWDITLGHDNKIGDVRYSIKFNLDTYKNTLVKYGADEINGVNLRREGMPWNTYYVMIQDGVYQNQAEIDNENVVRKYAGALKVKPGDIKYKDISGPDGVPDGIIDDYYDRAPVKGAFPEFNYGFNFSVSYKMFDLSCFFQGVQGKKLFVAGWGISPFNQAAAPPVFWRDAWDGEGTSNSIPHIYIDGYGPMQAGISSFYLRDASYLRMKSIQLGFNVPNKWTRKAFIQDARLYFSGDNLLTFTNFFDGQIDPERTGNSSADAIYPQAKMFTFGLKVTF